MSNDKKDPPIQEEEFINGVKVINFGDIRVARGLTRRPYTGCKHVALVYDKHERRVWCKDCERNIESFDAFMALVENFHDANAIYVRMKADALEARDHNLHLIAAKNIEKAWRGRTMAIPCPHCRGGLLPEDFEHIRSMCSAEIERRKRKK